MFSNLRERKRGEPLTDFERLATGISDLDRRARAALELWLEAYPLEHRDGLVRRVRGDGFYPAFFELYLHALWSRLGFEPEVHPKVSHEHERAPDFLLRRSGVPQFYLEATVVGVDSAQSTQRRRLEKAHLALKEVLSKDFDISLERADFPEENFPRKTLIRSVESWLKQLDPLEVDLRIMVSGERGEPANFDEGDLSLRLWAIPRPVLARGLLAPVRVTLINQPVKLVVCEDSVRARLHEKKRYYGQLLLPYVIAVNALESGADLDDIQDAAFGSLTTHLFGEDAGAFRTVTVRSDNGAIADPTSDSAERVSAVLADIGLTPWSMFEERITPVLIQNAETSMPLPAVSIPLLTIPDGGEGPESLANRQYVPARRLLGLDRGIVSP